MKIVPGFLISLCLVSSLYSCKKASTETLDDRADTSAVLKTKGSFISWPSETVTGQAKVYLQNGVYKLALENFSTTNGPDLKVYLSKETHPVNFIKLGDLRSTNGNQLYNIPGTIDYRQYKYALIHCERFNHLFGSAELE